MKKLLIIAVISLLSINPVSAQSSAFHAGEAIPEYGPIADVDSDMSIPADMVFKVSYDLVDGAKAGEVNRSFTTAARFINMHYAAGVPLDNMKLALIVHGSASLDLTKDEFYGAKKEGAANGNAAIIAALLDKGVEIIICGQSAVANGIAKDDLLPGVKMSLSAMTSHAIYQQNGYTLNPF